MKFVAYEVFEVEGTDLEDARNKLQLERSGVVQVSDELRTMFHPVHLQSVQEKFGHIKPAPVKDTVELSVAKPDSDE